MIELFFVLFIIPMRVKFLAKSRGENWIKWSLVTIGAWFGAEILVGTVIMLVLMMYASITKSEFNLQLGAGIAYGMGMVAALITATLIVRRLAKKPEIPTPSEDA